MYIFPDHGSTREVKVFISGNSSSNASISFTIWSVTSSFAPGSNSTKMVNLPSSVPIMNSLSMKNPRNKTSANNANAITAAMYLNLNP